MLPVTPQPVWNDGVDDLLDARLSATGRGDETAFAALYDEVAPRIHGVVLRILAEGEQAERLTEEVFLEIWRTSSRFDPRRGSALSWIMTLAHQSAVTRARSTPGVPGQRPAGNDPGYSAGVRGALAALAPRERAAVELAYFGGHRLSEVSEALQVPHGTATACVRDGLTRLRDLLEPEAIRHG